MMPSVPQLLIILAIVVLLFGAKRLRNLGGDLGSAVKGFKTAVKDETAESDEDNPKLKDDAVTTDSAVMRENDEQKKSA